MTRPQVLCTCSKCRQRFCQFNGELTRGRAVTSRTRNKHVLRQQWDNAFDEEQAEATVSNTILLTSTSNTISRQGSKILPVRRSDSQKTVTVQEDEGTNTASRGLPLASPAHTFSNIGDRGAEAESTVKMREKVLADLNSMVDRYVKTVPQELTFSVKPKALSDEPPDPQEGHFTGVRFWLQEQQRFLEDMAPIGHHDMDQRRLGLIGHVGRQIGRLDRMKRRAWSKRVAEELIQAHLASDGGRGPLVVKDERKDRNRRETMEHFILAALIMVAVLHSVAAASRIYGEYILRTLEAVLFGAFVWTNTRSGGPSVLTPTQAGLFGQLPRDVNVALSWLGLEPDFLRYACCPECFATYAPDVSRPHDPYPHTCTFQETDKPVCGASLVYKQTHAPNHKHAKNAQSRITYEPLLVFPFRAAKSWLLDMLLRPGNLQTMRKAWDSPPETRWTDMFHAPALRSFLGPDRKTPFSQQPNNHVHLVFSLFIDWFNPFGNKKAGKSHSIGAMYMVCMNLPVHLRYRPENIYLVAIIPGPKEPETHQLNHLLRPLIDEMLILWHRGMLFRVKHMSVTVRAAIIPLVCDLPALRKTAGFAGHQAKHFCSFCGLSKDDINNLDRSTWTRMSWEEHLLYATQWRDAATEKERDDLFKRHGLRWSELLRLEYWDPTQFAVVDAMHNLFLGELRHHCREVWGIDVKDKNTDLAKVEPHDPKRQELELLRVVNALRKKSKTALDKIRKGYIVAVAEVNGVVPGSGLLTKAAYCDALLEWTSSVAAAINLPPVLQEATKDFHVAAGEHDISKFRVLDQATIDQIRQDIAATYFPSWMERPPRNFGSPSHGKLKADQWRTVCTVSLILTLCRVWGASDALEKHRLLLENFVSLVCAVDLATRRTMDMERVQKFDAHMMNYLSSLRSLFSHHLVPNHHLSLHMWECLSLFGPVHAWWAFPFERYNGLLQNLNTNNKSNKMALTFMRYFYIGANLRALMNSTQWPQDDAFRSMVAAYQEAVASVKGEGVRVADFDPFEPDNTPKLPQYNVKQESKLPRLFYERLFALLSPSAQFSSVFSPDHRDIPLLHDGVNYVPSLNRNEMIFATRKAGLRNSFVLFRDSSRPTDDGFPRAGQIVEIFLHGRNEDGKTILDAFCVIDEYRPLHKPDVDADPYRRFPDLQTRLFYNEVESTTVVRFRDVQCHFAALFCEPADLQKPCVVARSLSRD